MAKRFKLRISRVIPSFQSCRSKDPSDLPSNPVPSLFRLSPVNNTKLTDDIQPPKPRHSHSSLRRHVSSAITSVGCAFRSKSTTRYLSDGSHTESSLEFYSWQKEEKWHVIAKVYDDETPRRKIYNSSVFGNSDHHDDAVPPPPPPPPRPKTAEKMKQRSKTKKTTPRVLRVSTSSADSGLFSSEAGDDERDDDDEETETLVSSSRSFSTETSSEFSPQLETIRETPNAGHGVLIRKKKKKKKKKNRVNKKVQRVKRCVSKQGKNGLELSSPESGASPARLSVFQRLIPCTVEGKVRESFAVVKKSEDPYEDFRRSMMEMILEKQMCEEKDLEQLLHCFLSLNSREHHGVIVEAFSEIWEALFCKNSSINHVVLRRHRRKL